VELRQLRYFVAVARNESFKKAAMELHIAQPAISRQIRLLEHELKSSLFTRHTRGSIPTEEGLLLLEEAERILHLTEQAKQKLLFHKKIISGPVSVGLAPALAEWLAPDLMAYMVKTHPEVQLRFCEGLTPRLRRMLTAGEIQVAVLSLNVDPTYLILGRTIHERVVLVGQPNDPLLELSEPLRLGEIVDLPIVLAGIRGEGLRAILDRALAESGLSFSNIVAEVETMFTARPMVSDGFGYTISLASAVEKGIEADELAVRPIETLTLDRIVARSAKHSPSRATLESAKQITERLLNRLPRRI